ncbi:MAG: hypothetical protein HYT76_01620 [Deltaproteobacteria bacterium]|nr:hypothetical protein [Deltaproteobacteria bacterium]
MGDGIPSVFAAQLRSYVATVIGGSPQWTDVSLAPPLEAAIRGMEEACLLAAPDVGNHVHIITYGGEYAEAVEPLLDRGFFRFRRHHPGWLPGMSITTLERIGILLLCGIAFDQIFLEGSVVKGAYQLVGRTNASV